MAAFKQPSWRDYQARYGRLRTKQQRRRRLKLSAIGVSLLVITGILYAFLSSSGSPPEERSEQPTTQVEVAQKETGGLMSKKDVQVLLSQIPVDRLITEKTPVPFKGHDLQVDTSLDMELQSYLDNKMDRKNSRYIGIVVMEADTGRILALAGFDKTDSEVNPCLARTYPAASIFKMVTAAAAVDHLNYGPDTTLKFNGYKHTLYKSQLKEQNNSYTNTISFKNAFAQSVNPVFGKIGTLKLGKEKLSQSADAFGFNQSIDFELAVTPSHFQISDDPYNWAEIASGFNNDTTISPLHGAIMVSAVLNGGLMIAPTIVDSISDGNGNILYRPEHPERQHKAMSAKAAGVVKQMMKTTVLSGTGKRVFRGIQRHRTLSHLQIGGKTGSIFNRIHDARFDWFVGFAEEKGGGPGLAVSVLVTHEEYIGIRAGRYARMAMTRFFENQLAHHAAGAGSANS